MLVPVIYTNIETGRVVYGVLDEARGRYMSGSVAECERALRARYWLWVELSNFSHYRWTITRLTRID